MLFLGRKAVESLLDAEALVDALAPAMAELSKGAVSVPQRTAAEVRERDAAPLWSCPDTYRQRGPWRQSW